MQAKHLEDLTAAEKRALIQKAGGDAGHLADILLALQGASPRNFIDGETAGLVAEELGLSEIKIRETLAFYAMLETKPRGRYVLELCDSAPCRYAGSEEIAGILKEELRIGMGETTEDGLFSLCHTPCVGACDIGPVIKVGDEVHGNLTPEKIRALLAALRAGGQGGDGVYV